MKKDIYKGKINEDGIELAPDWVELKIHPITGYYKGRCFDSETEWYHKQENREKRRKYMREYQKELRKKSKLEKKKP